MKKVLILFCLLFLNCVYAINYSVSDINSISKLIETNKENVNVNFEVEKYVGDVDIELYNVVEVNKTIKKYEIVKKSNESNIYDIVNEKITAITLEKIKTISKTNKIIEKIIEKKFGKKDVGWGYSVYTKIYVDGEEIKNASWFNMTWFNRRKINISSVYQLDNFTLKIILNNSNFNLSSLNSDCSDIRFTDENLNVLNHYVVECNRTNSTLVYVKFNLTYSQNIYIYYNNSYAVDTSNENTFTLYEDFNNCSYNQIPDSNKLVVFKSDANYKAICDGQGNLTLITTDYTDGYILIRSNKSYNTVNIALEVKRRQATNQKYTDIGFGNSTTIYTEGMWHPNIGAGVVNQENQGASSSNGVTRSVNESGNSYTVGESYYTPIDHSIWHLQTLTYTNSTNFNIKTFTNNVLKHTLTNTSHITKNKFFFISQGRYSASPGNYTQYIDYILFYNYIDNVSFTINEEEKINILNISYTHNNTINFLNLNETINLSVYSDYLNAVNCTMLINNSVYDKKEININNTYSFILTKNLSFSLLNYSFLCEYYLENLQYNITTNTHNLFIYYCDCINITKTYFLNCYTNLEKSEKRLILYPLRYKIYL